MTRFATYFPRAAAPAALLLLVAAGAGTAGTLRWDVRTSSGGSVIWATSSPADSGVIQGGRTISFDDGASVDFTFQAEPGYELTSVKIGPHPVMKYVDASGHVRFGPIDAAPHPLVATFSPTPPTGSFGFNAPADDARATTMVDVTGNYSGVSPNGKGRAYAFDVAQDEQGKVTGMGTIDGISPTGGGPIQGAAGSVRTVGGTPTLDAGGSFDGTRDGVDVAGRGSMSAPYELTEAAKDMTVSASLSYRGEKAGVKAADSNVPASMAVDDATQAKVRRGWRVRISVRRVPAAKSGVLASAELHLPSGDVILFPETAAKFSATKGYKLKFAKGMNATRVPAVLDIHTKVTIKGMTLAPSGSTWTPTAGTIQYVFLGQQGVRRPDRLPAASRPPRTHANGTRV